MRKLFSFVILSLILAQSAFAFDARSGFYNATSDNGTTSYTTQLLANGRKSFSTVLFSSSTTLTPANLPFCLVLKSIGNNATAENTKLPAGVYGQMISFLVIARGPAGSWVIQPDSAATTPVIATGWNSITLTTVGQNCTLLYVSDPIGWIIISNTGAVSTPSLA